MPPARRRSASRERREPRSQATREAREAREAARQEREARQPREKKPRRRGDLITRILVAVPLAIATIIFNNLGGLPFALFLIAAGLICMHEAYGLLKIWRPVAAVGFGAVLAMVLVA